MDDQSKSPNYMIRTLIDSIANRPFVTAEQVVLPVTNVSALSNANPTSQLRKLIVYLAFAAGFMMALMLCLITNRVAPVETACPIQNTFIHIDNLTQTFNFIRESAVGPQPRSKSGNQFVLTFINVMHWEYLTGLNIDIRLFNYVLATTWSQWLCHDTRSISLLVAYGNYLNKTTHILGETSADFKEYEFISSFRNLSVVGVSPVAFLPPDTLNMSRREIDKKFISFLQKSVDFINSNHTDTTDSGCDIVRSFNEIRNSIFDLKNEKLTLFLSEFSSNVFTFASYLSLNFPDKSSVLDDDKKAIAVAIKSVFNYMIDSLAKIEKNFPDHLNQDKSAIKALKDQMTQLIESG